MLITHAGTAGGSIPWAFCLVPYIWTAVIKRLWLLPESVLTGQKIHPFAVAFILSYLLTPPDDCLALQGNTGMGLPCVLCSTYHCVNKHPVFFFSLVWELLHLNCIQEPILTRASCNHNTSGKIQMAMVVQLTFSEICTTCIHTTYLELFVDFFHSLLSLISPTFLSKIYV